MRGITCATCAAVAEVALRQRLAGVGTVSISQSRQTIAVTFSDGRGIFSPAVFRDSVAGIGVEVVAFHLDACGVVEESERRHWFVAGESRFGLDDARGVPTGELLCVSGQLDDQVEPYRLALTAIYQASL